jgi:hypothetical protein
MREQLLLYRRRLLERLALVGEDIKRIAATTASERWHAASADGESLHRILAT